MAKRSERISSPGESVSLLASGATAAGTAVLDHAPDVVAPARSAPLSRSAQAKRQRSSSPQHIFHTHAYEEHAGNRQAELFYLQKQIQQQTPMIFVMEDGARVQGIIEWYDRHSIKVRGKSRVLVFKSAIKYLYKAGELGSAPGE